MWNAASLKKWKEKNLGNFGLVSLALGTKPNTMIHNFLNLVSFGRPCVRNDVMEDIIRPCRDKPDGPADRVWYVWQKRG